MPIAPVGLIAQEDWPIPAEVAHQARRCLTDLVGVLVAGRTTECSRILYDVAAGQFGAPATAQAAILPIDGRCVSMTGCAMAVAGTIDSIDAHDGLNPAKGHAGVAVLAAILAHLPAAGDVRAETLFRCLIRGYEIGCRAGLSMHRLYHDYHASGSWNALAAVAAAAGLRRLGMDTVARALSAAEFYAPRGLMMPVIQAPDMRKDSATGGALAGLFALELAARGFTATNARLICEPETQNLWADIGERWYILEQYFKPFPVCRWAQPPVIAALELHAEIAGRAISSVEVETFQAAAALSTTAPIDTDQAQYSLPYCVATALLKGRLGLEEISHGALDDEAVLQVARDMRLAVDPKMEAKFPQERAASLRVRFSSGEVLQRSVAGSLGDPSLPLSDEDLVSKAKALATPLLGAARAAELIDRVWSLTSESPAADVASLASLLLAPRPEERQSMSDISSLDAS